MRKGCAIESANRRDEAKKKMRTAEGYCAFLSGWQSNFIAQSLTMSSEVFSASMMTIAKLNRDMDYTGAKLATKRSIIYVLLSA